MALLDDRYVVGESISQAWVDAVRAINAVPGRKVVHLIVRILDPTMEVPEIRRHAQALIDKHNRGRPSNEHYYDIETTRNTIFPAAWARRNPEPRDLAAYYRERYIKDGLKGFCHNERGTYFGRIVAYPRGKEEEPGDQLTDTVRKLRSELAGRGGSKSSRYEINIYNEKLDRSPMSFPCMAHLSLHLHDRRLHLQAVYRNEAMISRAYGNYLGVAELQRHISAAVRVQLGELIVIAGHAELEAGNQRAVREMLHELADRDAA
jgi:thymidylate synthase